MVESEISLTQKVCNCYEIIIIIMKYHVLSICIYRYILIYDLYLLSIISCEVLFI